MKTRRVCSVTVCLLGCFRRRAPCVPSVAPGLRLAAWSVVHSDQRAPGASYSLTFIPYYTWYYMCNNGGTQPCARGAAAHTRHYANSRNAAHAERGPACMCVQRAPSRARLYVAPPGSACSRRPCPAVRWSDRAHAAARGNPDESVAADASGASRAARGGHTPERDVGPDGLPRSALQSRPMRG